MKTKEELDALKKEYESLGSKLQALDENELAQVTGGGENTNVFMPKAPVVTSPMFSIEKGNSSVRGSIGPIKPPNPYGPTQVMCRQCHTSYPYSTRTNYCGFCGAKDWCTDLDPEFFDF